MLNIQEHFKLVCLTEAQRTKIDFVRTAFYQWADQLGDLLPDCEDTTIALVRLKTAMLFSISAIERSS